MNEYGPSKPDYSVGRFPPVYLPPVRIILGASSFAEAMYEPDEDNMDTATPPPSSVRAQTSSSSSSGGISLNVHLTVPQQGGEGGNGDGSHTPNTPEILNSIVSMQQQGGPFAAAYSSSTSGQGSGVGDSSIQGQASHQSASDLNSPGGASCCSTSDGGTLSSPSSLASTPSSAMSVQQYCSQFIKEGLKLKVRQKLVASGKAPLPASPSSSSSSATAILESPVNPFPTSSSLTESSPPPPPPPLQDIKPKIKVEEELTEEDSNRRRRRRERNKIAATKCRNKKKHRTQLLIKESETLTTQNHSLKSEISRLEEEKRRLMEVLSTHAHQAGPQCKDRRRGNDNAKRDGEFLTPPTPTKQSSSSSSPISNRHSSSIPDGSSGSFTKDQVDIKPQILINDVLMDDQDEHPPSFPSGINQQQQQQQQQVGGEAGEVVAASHASSQFLGQRHQGIMYTYLDLDSRCVAI